ncbi:MAG: hypothetical protein HS118_00930 [Bacteroidia bacterium]|nr:hypothetical protein [Bacteroidia bacterium]
MYLFSVAVPVIALLFYTKKIFHLREVLISLLPLAVVISMSAYNYHVTGYFHYSTVNENIFRIWSLPCCWRKRKCRCTGKD